MNSDLLIVNGRIIDGRGLDILGWIAVSGDKIAAVGQADPDEATFRGASEIIDADGAYVIPGLMDSHVHFRTPGMEHKGNIASESRAAALGGVTSVFDMPNTNPPTVTEAAVVEKMQMAYNQDCRIGFKPFFGAAPGCYDRLCKIDPDSIAGVKLFMGTTTGAMGMPAAAELAAIMDLCAERNIVVMVHAEDNDIIAAQTRHFLSLYGSAADVPLSVHHLIRSREACLRSSAAAVELAMRHGTRLHLAHISTAEEVRELLIPGATAGKQITAETTPLYLDPVIACPQARTWRHKVNPAIKTEADAEVIREALAAGAIDTIGTDHAPHLAAEKQGGALTAASGAPSLQFALPVMLTYLPLRLIVEKMTAGPADIFGPAGYGALTAGAPADIAIVEEGCVHVISDADVATPAGWTPFVGRTVTHSVRTVVCRGKVIVSDKKIVY